MSCQFDLGGFRFPGPLSRRRELLGHVALARRASRCFRVFTRWADTMQKTKWTERDFEELSWHDNHVYGLSIRDGAHGAGRLVLDLDYITEWRCGLDKRCTFMLAPAELRFEEVTDLQVGIDYRGISMGPLSIGEIRREVIAQVEGFGRSRWRITFNFPESEIVFLAAGFVQE